MRLTHAFIGVGLFYAAGREINRLLPIGETLEWGRMAGNPKTFRDI